MRKYEDLLDDDKDGKVTADEVRKAKDVLEKARKKEIKLNHLRQLENFRARLVY